MTPRQRARYIGLLTLAGICAALGFIMNLALKLITWLVAASLILLVFLMNAAVQNSRPRGFGKGRPSGGGSDGE